jgi:hypothetical protein
MKAQLLFRIAALVLVLFAAGHTFGFLSFRPSAPEGQAVLASMNTVRLDGGFTYGGFYRGFGLFITAFLLFSAWLALFAARLISVDPSMGLALGWALTVTFAVNLALAVRYFGAPAIAVSVLAVVVLFLATLRTHAVRTPSEARLSRAATS